MKNMASTAGLDRGIADAEELIERIREAIDDEIDDARRRL